MARSGGGSPPAGTVGQLTPTDALTRQRVLHGVAAHAVARLVWDRRFQASVIMPAIAMAVAKSALKEGPRA